MTILRPSPQLGVVFSCRDAEKGMLTVQVPTTGAPAPSGAPPGMAWIVVSEGDTDDDTAAVLLDQLDQMSLARALRVLSRPAGGDTPPTSEVQAMAAYAEELENFGYKGAFLSDEVIRMTLAANTTVAEMQAYIETAFQNSQKREDNT